MKLFRRSCGLAVCAAFVMAGKGLAEELPNHAELTKAAEDKFAKMDTDKNGEVSYAEFAKVEVYGSAASIDGDKSGTLSYGEIVGTILWVDADKKRKAMDSNTDSKVNVTEFTAAQNEADKATASTRFSKIDSDNNGDISTSELFVNNKTIWLSHKDAEIDKTKAKAE